MVPVGTDDRSELIAEAEREQSDHEDWLPNDHEFWQPLDQEEDDEDSGD